MNDHDRIRLAVVVTLAFTFIFFLFTLYVKLAYPQMRVKITIGEMDWSQFFKGPYEKAIFVFMNQEWIGFHTYNEYGIDLSPAYMIEKIKSECGMEMIDVATIIHNHPTPRKFTPGDNYVYNYFLDSGFRGAFMIYYPATDKTIKKEK